MPLPSARRLIGPQLRLPSGIARLSDGLDERAQPRHDRRVARQRLELGYDEREGGDQSRKGDRRLSNDAELDLPFDEGWSDDEGRNDLDHPIVAGGEEANIAVDRGDRAKIGDEVVEPTEQLSHLRVLISRGHDGVRVISDRDEPGAEARFLVQLVVVQSDQRAPKQKGEERAARRVEHGDTKQERADGPQSPREGHDREGAVERHESEGKGCDREGARVFGNALVRIGGRCRNVEALIGAIGKVTAQDSAGHRITPQKSESLLAEASDHSDKGQGGEDANIDKGLPDKAGHVAIGNRRHEIPADIAVDDVQRVRRAEEQDKRGEDELGLPANFRLRKSLDRPDKTDSGRLERNGLRIHELTFADSLWRLAEPTPSFEQRQEWPKKARKEQ